MTRRELIHLIPAGAALAGIETSSGKGRLKSALCAYSYRDELKSGKLKYEDLVRICAEQGVDGLDMTVYWVPNTADEFLLPLKRLAYRMGIEIYSIAIRTDMCKPPGEEQAKELAEVRKWVDFAQKLGAGHIRVFGGRVPKGNTEDEAAGWVVGLLSRSAEYAGAKGVILGLENHGGITEKAARILEIIKKVDSPWVGVNLDTGNFNTNVYPQIEMLIPYSVNVQVKVNARDGGTRTQSDWDRVAKGLHAAGYKGYLALEYEEKEDPMAAVPRHLQRLRAVTNKYSA